MYPSYCIRDTLVFRVVGGILLSSVWTWANEPSAPVNNSERNGSTPHATDTQAAATPAEPAPATPATPPEPSVVQDVGTAPAPGASNSLAASPYGVPANEPAVPANEPAVPAQTPTPPAEDVPATLLDSSFYAMGGFGGFGVMYTRFAGSDYPLLCGEGAVIIDHAFTLGGGGCGIPDTMRAAPLGIANTSTEDRLRFGYGGAIARYHLFSRKVTNLAVGVLIGAGGVVVGKWNGATDDPDNFEVKNQDAVFIIEPQVAGFANLTRWLRFGAVAGYRIVSGVDIKGLNASDIRGPTLGGQLQGGWF